MRPFGAKNDGVPLHGLLIRVKANDPVEAARAGKVAFVDEGLRGYGRTVIVEHEEGFSTVYAGNFEILVKPGQELRRGELIGKISGAVYKAAPELYFEIRRDGRAEDPIQYLSGAKTLNHL